MRHLVTRSLAALAAFALTSTAFAAEGWMDDYDKALEKAKTEKKIVLADFTGSDWCGWCKKMVSDVFEKDEFKQYAEKNLVLLEVDFPAQKKLDDKVKAQNAKLKDQYKIEGYPTFVVLDGEGKQLAKWVGYQQGGPAGLIAKLDALKK